MLFVSIVKNQKAKFKMGGVDVMKLYLNKTETKFKNFKIKNLSSPRLHSLASPDFHQQGCTLR